MYRMVFVFHDGHEFSTFVELHSEQLTSKIQRLMRTGKLREVRFEPAPDAPAKRWPPESWAEIDPLEVDADLPPLDRPKIP